MSALRGLVTGGAGFIGSHLVDRLVEQGWRVRVLDDFSRGSEANLERSLDAVDLRRVDLLDREGVAAACADIDVVFHLAAIPSVPESVADPVGTHAVNVTGTLHVLEAARRAGVGRVVFAASCAAYGDDDQLPKAEHHVSQPISPYALQKVAGEQLCALYSSAFGLPCVALRYFNVYGPRQDPRSEYAAVVARFLSAALAGDTLRVFGDGEQTRDFVYVGDVVSANLCAATRPCAGGALVNVASGRQTSLNALIDSIRESRAQILGEGGQKPLDVRHEEARAGDILHSWADVSVAQRELAFRAQVDLAEGLRLTGESIRTRGV